MTAKIVLVHGLIVEKGIEKALRVILRALSLPKTKTEKGVLVFILIHNPN